MHIALLWSAVVGGVAVYRHIAPLERRVEFFNFNGKPMEAQRPATCDTITDSI